jgi:hypothetical protein
MLLSVTEISCSEMDSLRRLGCDATLTLYMGNSQRFECTSVKKTRQTMLPRLDQG